MKMTDTKKYLQIFAQSLFLLLAIAGTCGAFAADAGSTTTVALAPCGELPQGELSEAELEKLVPADSGGRVRVAWGTESQEETYGFNILRAGKSDGPWLAINKAIIPGEGTTSAPNSYCYEDAGLERKRVYFYQIEEVTNSGTKTIVAGTEGTKVTVKTVEEERAWLKKKAAQSAAQ